LIGFFLLLPLVYTVGNIINKSFDVRAFLEVFTMALSMGVGLSLVIMAADYYTTEKLKKRLKKMELQKVGDGNLKLLDKYTSWRRRIEIKGTLENREVWINHRFEKGWWGPIPYLDIYVDPLQDVLVAIKVDKELNTEEINKKIKDALAANKMYAQFKFD
jgi:hypothetical protein